MDNGVVKLSLLTDDLNQRSYVVEEKNVHSPKKPKCQYLKIFWLYSKIPSEESIFTSNKL